MDAKKFIITGGHLTPAYAFGEYALSCGNQIWFVSSQSHASIESAEIERLGIPFIQIKSPKFDRFHRFRSLITWPLLLKAIYQSKKLLNQLKPDCVITFGSYTGVPLAIAAKMIGIPIVMHEQTRTVGLANRIIDRIATSSIVSYKETKTLTHAHHVEVVGNILRHEIWYPKNEVSINLHSDKPILFITGGNQGAAAINEIVFDLIPSLLNTYQLVWQIGKWESSNMSQIPNTVVVKSWFNPDDQSWLLHHARIVISRGGANTTAEIMACGIPSILIPLPISAAQEQQKNSEYIENKGAGIVIKQTELTSESLHVALSNLETNYSRFYSAAQQLKFDQNPNAVSDIYRIVLKACLTA